MNKYTVEQIAEIINPIMQDYGVETAGLFGSYARGEATESSDIDIVINCGKVKGLKFFGLWDDVEAKLGKHVDLVDYAGLHYESASKLTKKLLKNIVNDEVRFYEQR